MLPEAVNAILCRAAERGEVRLERTTSRLAARPGDLVRHEVLVTHATVREHVPVEIVDEIFLPLVLSTVL